MTQHSAAKLTFADYEQFPDDGLRHEIIEGEHYVSPSPSTRHQRILLALSHLIQSYLDTHPIGEIFFAPYDVLLSEFNILVPDLIYVSRERAELVTEKNLQGAPDLVVEILSSSTTSRDKRLKRDVYERTGVGEYWIVDPKGDFVEVHRRGSPAAEPGFDRTGGTFQVPLRYDRTRTLTTPLFSGLELPLGRILA